MFRFASAANRDAFAADAERYAPRYGGFCAYGVAHGYKVKIEPEAFTIADSRLGLNYDLRVPAGRRKGIPGCVRKAGRAAAGACEEAVRQDRIVPARQTLELSRFRFNRRPRDRGSPISA